MWGTICTSDFDAKILFLHYRFVVIGMECDCFLQAMVSCQMLSELEEVIQYKLVPERREIIRQIWWERLQVHLCKGQGWRCWCAGKNSFLLSRCDGSASLSISLSIPIVYVLTWVHTFCLHCICPGCLGLFWLMFLRCVLIWHFNGDLSLEIDVYRTETLVSSPRLLISLWNHTWKYWFG